MTRHGQQAPSLFPPDAPVTPTPLHALFLVESGLGPAVMGHARFAESLRVGLAERADVKLRFAGLPPLSGAASTLVGEIRGLRRFDLDLQPTRWHLVQSRRAREILRRELDAAPADVVGILSHAIALSLGPAGRRQPAALFADTEMWDWRAMGIWRPVRRHSRTALRMSLALQRRALRSAALVVAWSEWTRDALKRAAPGADVVALHPGLDLERYRPVARTPRSRPRVLFVGGRFALKGGDDLLAALEPMLGSDVELDLVTPAPVPERDGLRRHELGPEDPRLLDLYQQADLLCLPSYGDAVPWVVLEALACTTPVVATPVGAVPEFLDGGAAGSLVPARDPAALRAAISSLLDDGVRRAEMGAHGRALCEERYDARVQSSRLIEHFDVLTAVDRRPG